MGSAGDRRRAPVVVEHRATLIAAGKRQTKTGLKPSPSWGRENFEISRHSELSPVHAIVPGWVAWRLAARSYVILLSPAGDGPRCVFG